MQQPTIPLKSLSLNSMPPANHQVVLLAYDGLCTFEYGCAVEVFALQRPELPPLHKPWYQLTVCSCDGPQLQMQGGTRLLVEADLSALQQADTVIIPGWKGIDAKVPDELIAALQAAHQRGARLASICSGVFVLAATGLLNGKTATTHWRYTAKLRQRYPAIQVQANALYCIEPQLCSSAGSAAGLDMMLELIRQDHGAGIANLVAQRLVIPPQRFGDQAQFVQSPLPANDRQRIARLMDWMRSDLCQPYPLAVLARQAALSSRQLQRLFVASCGLTPQQWLLRERLDHARLLLETTQLPIHQLAAAAGFGSEAMLRKHFRQQFAVSPAQYRRQFSRCPSR